MTKRVVLLIISLVGTWAVETPLLGQELMVERINSIGTTWKAGINLRFQGLTEEEIRRQMGTLQGGPEFPEKTYNANGLPDSFDCRHGWDNCPTVSEIRDQGSCGSGWAMAAVEVMSDRYCIHHNQTAHISAEELNSCCTSCGKGCGGGFSGAAWDFWIKNGLVTGGNFNSHTGCQPYSIEPCDHHNIGYSGRLSPCLKAGVETPNCSRTCESGYSVSYDKDKHFGTSVFSFRTAGSIEYEIMMNGPVEGTMKVYEDFLSYKTGVYRHVTGSFLGNHSVRIVGWGEEITDSPYWTVANSWNTDWGDGGFFQILRGKDEVGIESSVVAGLPEKYID